MAEATTGYYRSGESWLHRRSPITKLLALGLVLLASFVLPPAALAPLLVVVVLAGWSAGLLRPMLASLRIPIVLLRVDHPRQRVLLPWRSRRHRPARAGGADQRGPRPSGVISAGRLLVVFLASVLFLFTTLADDILEALVARGVSHRLAFVVLSVVQMVPRMQARAGAILEAQQARGLPITGSILTRVRALVPLIGPVILGSLIDVRERTLRPRGPRLRDAARADVLSTRRRPAGRSLAARGDPRWRPWPWSPSSSWGLVGDRCRPGSSSTPSGSAIPGAGSRALPTSRSPSAPASGSVSPVAPGAGKSTLALVAAGFIPRVVRATVSGRLIVDGQAQPESGGREPGGHASASSSRRPPTSSRPRSCTVREELAFGLENLGVPRDEMDARIDAALALLGIGGLAERAPFALSGGEQQRVAIASMVAMGTDVLVLDEPTAQLDPAGTLAVARMLDELAVERAAPSCAPSTTRWCSAAWTAASSFRRQGRGAGDARGRAGEPDARAAGPRGADHRAPRRGTRRRAGAGLRRSRRGGRAALRGSLGGSSAGGGRDARGASRASIAVASRGCVAWAPASGRTITDHRGRRARPSLRRRRGGARRLAVDRAG